MNKGLWFLSFFLLLAGLGAIIAGRILDAYHRRQHPRTVRVRAKVVDLKLKENPAGHGGQFRNAYFPVLEYYAGGKLIKTVYPQGSYPSRWEIGQEIWLEYNRKDPGRYVLWKPVWQDYLPAALSAAGVVLFLAGAVLFLLFAMRQVE